MDASLVSFSSIVSTLNTIPLHQRSYSWKEKHWLRLWTTIVEAYIEGETSIDSRPSPDVFMGAMVRLELEKKTAKELSLDAGRTWNSVHSAIVDGQQRVVTLCILLAAIRDSYYGMNSVGSTNVTSEYLRFRLGLTTSEFGDFKLRVQSTDKNAYKKVVDFKNSENDLEELANDDSPVAKAYMFFMHALRRQEDDQLAFISADYLHDDNDEDDDEEQSSPVQGLMNRDDNELEVPVIDDGYTSTSGTAFSTIPRIAQTAEIDWKTSKLLDPETLVTIVGERLKFAVVQLGAADESMAFEIFETLNDTNEPLDNVDKFRNGYFMLEPDQAENIYQQFWLPLEREHQSGMGRSSKLNTLEDFFFNETIRRFGWTPSSKTYSRLMGYIKAKAQNGMGSGAPRTQQRNRSRVLEEEFNSILNADVAYRRMHGWLNNNESPTPQVIENHLSFIRDYDASPVTPIVMEVLLWGHQSIEKPTVARNLADGLASIEGFLARRTLAGIPAQQLRSQVADVGPELRSRLREIDPADDESGIGEIVRDLFQAMGSDRYPDDRTLEASLDVPIYERVGKRIQLFRVLWGLEQQLSSDHASMQIPPYGTGRYNWSIEHVLPQGVPRTRESNRGQNIVDPELEPSWAKYWAQNNVQDPDREFRMVRHSIGNLTLLLGRDNSYLGTQPFAEKQKFYGDRSDLKLTKSIVRDSFWGPAEIRERGLELIHTACDRWPY